MNCHRCRRPVLFLFPSGVCSACHAAQPASPPPAATPAKRKRGQPKAKKHHANRPQNFCRLIDPDDYHKCCICKGTMIPREMEFVSHYRRRHTCSKECASERIRQAQLGRWKTRAVRANTPA